MRRNPFVKYLNTLHNVDAENPSAYTEMSITNQYFRATMVERDVGNYIEKQLSSARPHVFILTGHAGDGKTAILYQVMKHWGVIRDGEKLSDIADVSMPNGHVCRCIKDFSELEADKRASILEDILSFPKNGKSAFLVANTGPLLSTFSALVDSDSVSKLVGAIDDNSGEIIDYGEVPISAINVATIDNSTFVAPFLNKILNNDLWSECEGCEKAAFCPIKTNKELMAGNLRNISDFITDHYIWQQEHGNKLTIRQIVAHLAYTITGGADCHQVKNTKGAQFRRLCSNNFFGYYGIKPDIKGAAIKAISDVLNEAYDQKRLRADEALFIKNDFSALPEQVQSILNNDGMMYQTKDGWQQAVRRAYIMLNCETDPDRKHILMENVFSTWFPKYLSIRDGNNPTSKDKDLIVDALKMLFLGSLTADNEIPITMRREENGSQCVQLVYDNLQKKYIKLHLVKASDFSSHERYKLYMSVKSEMLTTQLSLPLMNHFEEMRRGAIQTNIDPQLSQGIDSLRAQLIALSEGDESELEMRIITSAGWDSIKATYEDDTWDIN